MLPMYYGMLRMCCEQSRSLTRQLSGHQNLQWAFKNITPHPTQYNQAVEELFKLMKLFATRHPDASEQEQLEVTTFRRTTLSSYLASLDARVSWSTLINALQILVDNEDDRLLVIYNGGIEMCFEALHTLHSMHHEATACHVVGDMQELLSEMVLLFGTLRAAARQDNASSRKHVEKQAQHLQQQHEQLLQKQHEQLKLQHAQTPQQTQQQQQLKEKQMAQMQQHLQLQQMQQHLQQHHFLRHQHQPAAMLKGLPDAIKRLATLLNTFNPPELCQLVLDVLKELVRNPNLDAINILTPILLNCHLTASNSPNSIGPLGAYFPRRNKSPWPTVTKCSTRPPRPMVQMSMPHGEVFSRGSDAEHDALVEAFYKPYHDFIDVMLRMAVNKETLNESLVKLSCLVGIEATGLHFNLFPKFWVGIYNNKSTIKYAELLINNPMLIEYIHLVLRDERKSLGDQYIRSFLEIYYPKVSQNLPIARLLYTISYAMHSKEDLEDLCGDLFAIRVIAQSTGVPSTVRKQLRGSLKALLYKSSRYQESTEGIASANKKQKLDGDSTKITTKSHKIKKGDDDDEDDEEEETSNVVNKDESEEAMEVVPAGSDQTSDTDTNTEEEVQEQKSARSTEDGKVNNKPHKNRKREGTPSTASEDETEKVKTTENVESTAEQSEDDDVGLMTACGPIIASTMLAAKPSTEKQECKEGERESSSDEAANSIYTIHKSSSMAACVGDRLTVTLAKNSNKKTASDRQIAEHEKRCKMLHTMETYIRSILNLMQKDEEPTSSNASCNEQTVDKDVDERLLTISAVNRLANANVTVAGSESSSSDDSPVIGLPKSPSTTPPPLAPLSRGSSQLAITKVTSTATITTTNNSNVEVEPMSVGEDDEDEEADEEEEKVSQNSSNASSNLANGGTNETLARADVATIITAIKSNKAAKTVVITDEGAVEATNMETDIISSPASPADILTTATVDPTQL